MGSHLLPIVALPAMALLLANQGEVERAVELYALALRHPLVAQPRWYKDVFELPITEAPAALPPGSVTAAEERGRSQEVMSILSELQAELDD